MLLIGLGSKARQGKNFVANYIKEQNNSAKLYSFADELKLYCKAHHEELVKEWLELNFQKKLPEPKEDPIYGYTAILQWYGTDVARKANPNVWVQALDARIQKEAPELALITDVRFPEEAAYVKKKAVTLYR